MKNISTDDEICMIPVSFHDVAKVNKVIALYEDSIEAAVQVGVINEGVCFPMFLNRKIDKKVSPNTMLDLI